MKALCYLMGRRLRRMLIETVRRPARLITTLLVLALFGVMLFSAGQGEAGMALRDLGELNAMVFLLYAMIFFTTVNAGFLNGASFFTMADVNYLFTGPIAPRRILIYGLVKQLGASALAAVFLIFQYGWIHNVYGVGMWYLFAILIGYMLVMFTGSLTALSVYAFSSGAPRRRGVLRFCMLALPLFAVLYVLWPAFQQPSQVLNIAVARINGPLLNWFPVAGWMRAFAARLGEGSVLNMLPYLLALAAYVFVLIALFSRARADYYEDVLLATERAYAAQAAAKQGLLQEGGVQVKVGKSGLGGGWGESAFYYKQKVENRRAKVFLLDKMTLMFAAITMAFAFFMRDVGIISVLVFGTYMQFFSAGSARWVRELMMPYAYLVPASPFKKLIAICRQSIPGMLLDAALVMGVSGLIVGASAAEIAVCVLFRFSFGLLFMAANFLSERLYGTIPNKIILLVLYILTLIVLMIPGFAIGLALAIALKAQGIVLTVFVMALWNALVSALIAFLCRDILNYSELNNR